MTPPLSGICYEAFKLTAFGVYSSREDLPSSVMSSVDFCVSLHAPGSVLVILIEEFHAANISDAFSTAMVE